MDCPYEFVVQDMNASDLIRFRRLTPSGINEHDKVCQEIGRCWDDLSRAIQECVLVHAEFSHGALELAKVSQSQVLDADIEPDVRSVCTLGGIFIP